jgi:tRNA (guanine37-N1)-methyltransferase
MICGRYEGVNQRVGEYIVDEEISIGNYILTGGELPALTVLDSVTRLLPGVLGNEESLASESFDQGKELDFPVYTRPEEFNQWKVPEVLLSGNHQEIKKWRQEKKNDKNKKQ